MDQQVIDCDILIIGGGAAGCFAAITAANAAPEAKIMIAEKADIRRSGCLAAGVNALNAYITPGHTPDFYVDYASNDANQIVREDLLLTLSERLNAVTADLEAMGLVILKDAQGHYVTRGPRNIKINGENIKPLLARAARRKRNVHVLNHLNITDLLVADNTVFGAVGFSTKVPQCDIFRAQAVIVTTGGASGIYKPNNPGFSKHKMWYSPFNTGAGYAMGIRRGAEMTTFEMRFIALRCKDTIAPIGTLAQGVGAKQVNALGQNYEQRYGLKTYQRVWGTVCEEQAGRGPCYLKTDQITKAQEDALYHAYLNMAPGQTLRWLENGGPAAHNVEIEGTEPYIVGGHSASGYWVDTNRQTTIHNLFAAGDVAGGAPQKYVTGALAEGQIAAEQAVRQLGEHREVPATIADEAEAAIRHATAVFKPADGAASPEIAAVEAAMQQVMDEDAGGISQGYGYTDAGLKRADKKLQALQQQLKRLTAPNMHALMSYYEVKDRLLVARCVLAHLAARQETRWHAFAENLDHPGVDDALHCYINSTYKNGVFTIIKRPLVARRQQYEHSDRQKQV